MLPLDLYNQLRVTIQSVREAEREASRLEREADQIRNQAEQLVHDAFKALNDAFPDAPKADSTKTENGFVGLYAPGTK